MTVAIWLGSAAPVRSLRWLDGALAAAAALGPATAIAAGDATWLELAADRAARAGVASVAVLTDLQLDYLGWAQVVAAVVRQLAATTILVDEASRPERIAEVAAIAELADAAQLTHVVALERDGEGGGLTARRVTKRELQTVRIRGTAAIGLRIAGPVIEAPVPTEAPPSPRRLELAALGLDPLVLGHRALAPRVGQPPRRTAERIGELLAMYLAPREAR